VTFLLGHPVYGAAAKASKWQMRFNSAFKGLNLRFWRQALRWDMTQCSLDNVTYIRRTCYIYIHNMALITEHVIQNPDVHLPYYIAPHPSRP
jgi:hypothetical protein